MIKNFKKGESAMSDGQKTPLSKKWHIAVGVSVIALVLLLNVILGVLSYKKLLYIDLTEPKYTNMESFYTASEDFYTAIETNVLPSVDKINEERAGQGLEPLAVRIIFCEDSDLLDKSEDTRLVHYTARQLQNKFPDYIEIEYTDCVKNPSSVQAYKVTAASRINSTDVIVTFGGEFIVHGLLSFYLTDSNSGEVWGYNGEKKFASSIISLTLADSPVCAITTNHGEGLFDYSSGTPTVREEYTTFIKVIEGAGYEVKFIDLEKDEIPEDSRMMICFAPTRDFFAYGNLGESGVSEIQKLDKYLDGSNSFFYICDTSTPVLSNLEEYLAEWGIAPAREEMASGLYEAYKLFDDKNNTDDSGSSVKGKYTTSGYASTITADLRALSYPPAVSFGNATVLSPAENYDKTIVMPSEKDGERSVIYTYYHNGITRTMYDIFTSYETAYAQVGDEIRYANENNLYSVFTLTEEVREVQESSLSTVSISSYVLGLSSTQFLKNEFLDSSSYGNSDVLMAVLRATSSESVPVNIDGKAFYDSHINDALFAITNKALPLTLLIAIPLTLCTVAGIIVCIKRKYL